MQRFKVLVSCLAIAGTAGLVVAQDAPAGGQPPARERGNRPERQPGEGQQPRGMGRDALTPEKAKAAQELTAKGVAKRLGLTDDQTKALVKAYTEARVSHGEAMTKFRDEQRKAREEGGGGDPQESRQKMQDMTKKEREKFEKAVTAATSADVAKKAVASLGSFNAQWDRMVDTLAGFNLEAGKQQDALNAIEDFVVGQVRAREAAAEGQDRESQMEAMREARTKLNEALKKSLSEDQVAKFQAAIGGGGRQGGPGGPGGGGGDGERPRRRGGGGGEGGGGGGGGR